MARIHLTAKYRPRKFSEVAGQETIRAILSRAAETDSIAPAYMFSGTRGVGKTTLARILAKAVNCENGPAAEPCCECRFCRQISSGSAVDVVEIDAASNTGVDNIRSLREDVGYAPMECRYKVFIIDEAHMLSKSAFNALLKTLEEPPGRVAFILATTEPHKFPPTIVSRCQHYIFQRLTRKEIAAHLEKILQAEGVEHEAEAVKLLARRGAGSVRDAMSLMGQVLALGGERLEAADARRVLGLAGQEVFFRLMEAVHARDCVAISKILREVLDQGLDIGFFLSELIQVWRNLFILSQSGEKGFEVLDVPEEDAARWLQEWVPKLSLAHIHACWQLTLEGQQRVRASLDPSLALELLLLNLAFLPRLVPMRELEPPKGGGEEEGPADRRAPRQEPPPEPAPEPGRKPVPQAEANEDREPGPEAEGTEEKSWQGFLDFVAERAGNGLGRDLAQARGNFGPDGVLVLDCENGYVGDRLSDSAARRDLEAMAVEYFGEGVRVEVKAAKKNVKSREDREREAKEHPVVQAALRELDAGILGVDPQGK